MIKTTQNGLIDYSLGQLKKDNPSVIFPRNPTAEQLAQFGAYREVIADQPVIDEATQAAELVPIEQCEQIGGQWVRGWVVRDLTAEEIDAKQKALIPFEISARQARLALLSINKLADVDTAINAMPSPQKEQARIEWEYASKVERNHPFVESLAAGLALSSQEVDQLFIAGSKL